MKFKIITFSILASLALMSCTKNDLYSPKESEIIVMAGVAQTRAGYEGTSILPETFVMDVTQGADQKYDYSEVEMLRQGNTYIPEIQMLWAGGEYSSVNVKAMTRPYEITDIDTENPMFVSVCEDQSTVEGVLASDVLVATMADGDISINKDMINIDFKHLMSKLEITYAFGNGLSKDDVTFRSIELQGVCVAGGYSYKTMSFEESVSRNDGNVFMYHNAEDSKFEAIFFPYIPVINPKLVVNVTLSGMDQKLTCEIKPKKTAEGFVTGKRYTMTVTVNAASITPNAISIDSAWEDGNVDLDVDVDVDFGSDTFITD